MLNINDIALSKYNYKNFVLSLIPKYKTGSLCKKENIMFLNYFVLEELEDYYRGCSCLEEKDICLFLKYLKSICNE